MSVAVITDIFATKGVEYLIVIAFLLLLIPVWWVLERTRVGQAARHAATELRELERDNIVRALEAAGWKISGADGAAERLGLKPNTLGSRMKSLGIRRPGPTENS